MRTPTTLTGWLHERVVARPEATAIVGPDGTAISFEELAHHAAAGAGALRCLGVRRGDRVAVFLPNGLEWVTLLFGAARLGATVVGVNTRYRTDDLRHALRQSGSTVLVAADDFLGIDFAGVVAGALDGLADPPRVVWPDELRAQLAAAGTGTDELGDGASPDDLLIAFTTSGTTGPPKLAAHSHASVTRHAEAASHAIELTEDGVVLLTVPLCGTFGLVTLLAGLAAGAQVVVPDRFDVGVAADLMSRHRVTHLNGSDDMLLAVIGSGSDLGSWRRGVVAEFTNQGRRAVDEAEAIGVRLLGVYGSSETYALLAMRPAAMPAAERARPGGTLVDEAMKVRAADLDTGVVLPPGEAGELQFRGPAVLDAYLGDDGARARALTDDGWFRSGDLGTAEPDGRSFVYLARSGDSLRLAGFLTDPSEIERRLLTHPAVGAAQVVGARDADGREVAVAFVVADDGATVDESDLLAHCRAGLANYKVPRRVVTLAALPTVEGPNGVKVRKTELRDQAEALLH